MKNIIIASLIFVGSKALGFLFTAGMVWMGCYALGLMGAYSINFSWQLVFGIWLLLAVIRFFVKKIAKRG